MSAVFEEKTVNETQPTLSQRVGYVLVQMGDELEPLVLDYKSRYSHVMDKMAARLIAEMDKQIIEQLAAKNSKNKQVVQQDIALAIQVLGWLHFPDLVKKPQFDVKAEEKTKTPLKIPKIDFGMDGLEYQEMVRREWW